VVSNLMTDRDLARLLLKTDGTPSPEQLFACGA
jgi:hypothetical protein